MSQPSVAIVGAGPAGLMAADVLSQQGYAVQVFEQMPSAARKFLMAGKTGLNISHIEQIEAFIQRYDATTWVGPWVEKYDASWIRAWMQTLGIASYVGSSGRIFPVEMKAAPLLRAWLTRLQQQGVQFYYRHRCIDLIGQSLTLQNTRDAEVKKQSFDAVILACGAVSWQKLGSDGRWLAWMASDEVNPFQPSNAGVVRTWSEYMQPIFGQPLKGIRAWVETEENAVTGDIILTQYGFESGVIYRLNRALRVQGITSKKYVLNVDLLPQISYEQLVLRLIQYRKQSLNNRLRKTGLDAVKSALLKEIVDRGQWSNAEIMALHIKKLSIDLNGFRPIDEAISCAGGIKQTALSTELQLKSQPHVFCCGEMLDWDAPTGGYLLTACLASGRVAGHGVDRFLSQKSES
ncbi:TIGR03862 family flavoprotein [Acinetobacter sp. B5B]|uniref:TIGR03862 family flavoprotein n=1 Tax=Acinetobacter baretiae TaxID=2605383 RepID=UPI0018C2C7A8|nr:TIGR03862 family flavoprotein [Acinetobacter baretiae]MBF7682290.1 TIGR03862 family flavoprotein [Acinetobacter baretiae]MBF7685118.1 TIGR03862 family flavoprotein [Acinetobacter baretiae]